VPEDPSDRVGRPWWALVVAVVSLAAATWVVATAHGSDVPESTPMLDVAPGGVVTLDVLPHDHQGLYRAAAADPEAFSAVACYCGCEAFLDHRHLLDCFVRPDGGWERHATGCGVCLGEARDVRDMRADGVPLDEIVRRIDDGYGAITAPPST
jgi:hypothetical protein